MTLVELLLALVMLTTIAALAAVVTRAAAVALGHTWLALDRARTISVPAALLHEDLRDASVGDVALDGPTSARLVVPVGDATVCGLAAADLFVPRDSWSGERLPEPGRDVVRLLADPLAESWDTARVAAVASARCPDGAGPALRITLDQVPRAAVDVQVVEPVRIAVYRSGGADWFGMAPAGALSLQPFAGPLLGGSAGFALSVAGLAIRFTPVAGSDTSFAFPIDPP